MWWWGKSSHRIYRGSPNPRRHPHPCPALKVSPPFKIPRPQHPHHERIKSCPRAAKSVPRAAQERSLVAKGSKHVCFLLAVKRVRKHDVLGGKIMFGEQFLFPKSGRGHPKSTLRDAMSSPRAAKGVSSVAQERPKSGHEWPKSGQEQPRAN